MMLLVWLIIGGLFLAWLIFNSIDVLWFIWQGYTYKLLIAFALLFVGASSVVTYATFRVMTDTHHMLRRKREWHQHSNRLMEQQSSEAEILEESHLHKKEQSSL